MSSRKRDIAKGVNHSRRRDILEIKKSQDENKDYKMHSCIDGEHTSTLDSLESHRDKSNTSFS